MKVFLFILGVLLLVGPIVVVTYGHHYPRYSWKYKITVEIETPEGVKTGSAVRQISNSAPSIFRFPESGNPADVRGEAVVVDLGERGKVFALLPDQSWKNGIYQAFPTKAPSGKEGIAYYQKTLKVGMRGEWARYKPRFVMFKDPSDPKTITVLRGIERWSDEAQEVTAEGHFEDVFGSGYKLGKITVEITDEAISRNIANLPNYDAEFWKWYKSLRFNDLRRITESELR